jgi:hypothetical protein
MRAILATLAIVIPSLVGVSVEAIWRPFADNFFNNFHISWLGERWVGIDKAPTPPPPPKEPAPPAVALAQSPNSLKCLLRSGTDKITDLPETESRDDWQFRVSGSGIVSGYIEEEGRKLMITGIAADQWMVANYKSPEGGRGVFYLERYSNAPAGDYYVGYVVSWDCHSPTRGAALKCPYLLFKSAQEKDARKNPLFAEKCESLYLLNK